MLSLTEKEKSRLDSLCSQHMVKSLYLFGSATSKRFDAQQSDIDLVVEFNDKLALLDYADNYFSLLKNLEQLFGRKVDLLAHKALRNPVMIEEVEKSKIPLYAA